MNVYSRCAAYGTVFVLLLTNLAGLPGRAEDLPDLPADALVAQNGHEDPPLPGLGGAALPSGSPIFFLNYPVADTVRSAHRSGEPTVGVNWNTGNVFFKTNVGVGRATFDDTTTPPSVSWKDVTPLLTSVTTLDPLLITDAETGRTIDLQLSGEHSTAVFTDNDGETWLPTEPISTAPSFDHQKMGVGNFHAPVPNGGTPVYPNAFYYCSNGVELNQCVRSDDGGVSWGAPVPMDTTQCGGQKVGPGTSGTFNGHIAVGPDGTVYVPMRNCFDQPGVQGGTSRPGIRISRDNGLTWELKVVPDSLSSRSNPGVAVDEASNAYVLWSHGFPAGKALVRVLHPDGTWGPVTDVGAPFGVLNARFTEAVAGDAGRAAVSWLGSGPGGLDDCGGVQEFHLYVSFTYDAGSTWTTVDATPVDPVQRGGVSRNDPCRNLLDFNHMAIDKGGRVLVAWADGCTTRPCIARTSTAAMSRDALGVVARQTGGPTLRAASDPAPEQPVYAFARHGRVFAGQDAILDAAALGGQPPYAFAWDFDRDGAFDDAAGATVAFPTSRAGIFPVRVRATDSLGSGAEAEALVVGIGTPTPDMLVRSFHFDTPGCTDAEGWSTGPATGTDWHLTTFRPASAPCAWYHGEDTLRRYPTFNEANLVSPGGSGCFYLPPKARTTALRFQLAGRSETGFDFLRVQARQGCDEGPFTSLASFSGIFGNLGVDPPVYTTQTVGLEDLLLGGGGPFQMRFRFTADEVIEFAGFQVDDVELFIEDQPPVLEPVGDHMLFTTDTLNLQLAASDPDGDPLFFEGELPEGATLDRATGAFTWSPGDEQDGVHAVTFRATDGLLSDSETVTITVLNAPPVAAGSVDRTETDRRTPVQATSAAFDPDGSIASHLWDFGDGATSTEQDPSHTYTKLGTFQVTLTVTDDDGASTTADIAKVKVKNIKPKAKQAGIPAEANRVDPVDFQGSGSSDPDGSIASHAWDLGDGATSTAADPSHTYGSLGDFTATLTVTDDDGDSDTTSAVVHVVNLLPNPAFTTDPKHPLALLPTKFKDLTVDRDGNVVSWLWRFGDGATSTAQNPVHVYLQGGVFEVTLEVTDSDGGVARLVQNLHVCMPGVDASTLLTAERARLEVQACVAMPMPG